MPLETLDGQREVLDLEALEREAHDLVNGFRRERGLAALEWDEQVAKVARDYSRAMLVAADLDHDADGRSTAQRLRSAGIEFSCACENLGLIKGFNLDPAHRAVTGWTYSEAHRDNLLNDCVTVAAVGIAASPTGGFYVTWIARRPAQG